MMQRQCQREERTLASSFPSAACFMQRQCQREERKLASIFPSAACFMQSYIIHAKRQRKTPYNANVLPPFYHWFCRLRFIRSLFGWYKNIYSWVYLSYLWLHPDIIQAVGICHCLNGDFQFRAPTRNPENIQDYKRYWLHTLDSASERGMTDTDAWIITKCIR